MRVVQRILAMATVIWHNHRTGQPISRSLMPMTTDHFRTAGLHPAWGEVVRAGPVID